MDTTYETGNVREINNKDVYSMCSGSIQILLLMMVILFLFIISIYYKSQKDLIAPKLYRERFDCGAPNPLAAAEQNALKYMGGWGPSQPHKELFTPSAQNCVHKVMSPDAAKEAIELAQTQALSLGNDVINHTKETYKNKSRANKMKFQSIKDNYDAHYI